jgi:hypothetical protein
MTIRDLHSDVRTVMGIVPVAIGANGTLTGLVKDRQGYGGVEILAHYGAVTTTGSIVTLVVKEGDATGAMASVADANLLGTEALASLPAATPRTAGTTKEVTKRVGYIGNKRYVSCDAVKTGTTSVGTVGVTILLHNAYNAPTVNP